MAWTVAFALLGAMTFSILVVPVLASFLFRRGVKETRNPVLARLTEWYRKRLRWCVGHRNFTVGAGVVCLVVTLFLGFSGVIGSEFLPHLDEGSIWARGTLAQSTSLTEGTRFMNQARRIFAAFPEARQVISEIRPPG
jgi:cobalt-zinc-cadmium resistance protein CzcA